MSWLEKIQSDFIIRCGDGNEYTPNWLNATKDVEYNFSQFDFPNVAGSLVDRREKRGNKYSLEIYFQGDDHLDQSSAFEESANNKRFWTIIHPFYGALDVQPTSLSFDNTKYNVTKITGTVIETITEIEPRALVIPEDKIDEDVELLNEAVAVDFENNVVPDAGNINTMKASNEKFQATNSVGIVEQLDAQNYFNAFNDAQAKLNFATSQAGLAMRSTQTFLQAPARFLQSVKSRLNMLTQNYTDLKTTITGTLSVEDKRVFESQGATLISSICLASSIIFDDDDYSTRVKVDEVVTLILTNYTDYLLQLDTLQVGTGGNPEDFIPNADSLIQLDTVVNYTMGNLYDISFDAKQERVLVLTEDSDYINLTHRIYGIDFQDENIDELKRNNNFGINGILRIPKGTRIVYYI